MADCNQADKHHAGAVCSYTDERHAGITLLSVVLLMNSIQV